MIPASTGDSAPGDRSRVHRAPGDRAPDAPSLESSGAGRAVGRHVPMRRCVVCRTSQPQADLLRFVLGEGAYGFDERRRLGGRGTWVCRPCATSAVGSGDDKRLRSAFRGQALNMRELLEAALAAGPRRPSAMTARRDGGMDVR